MEKGIQYELTWVEKPNPPVTWSPVVRSQTFQTITEVLSFAEKFLPGTTILSLTQIDTAVRDFTAHLRDRLKKDPESGKLVTDDWVLVKDGEYTGHPENSEYNLPRRPGRIIRGSTDDGFIIVYWPAEENDPGRVSPAVNPKFFEKTVVS